MTTFIQKEQDSRKYLVYEKKTNDKQDTIAVEMMSNNRIDGLVPLIYIQIDEAVYMKYDITGLVSLKEYLAGVIGRQKFLNILESMADVVISTEDYMLESSSFVLDTEYIYVNPLTMKISMIILPIERQEISMEHFLRELLLGVQYDQTEDCGYVAALINFFSTSVPFSISAFREQVIRFKREKAAVKVPEEKSIGPSVKSSTEKKLVQPSAAEKGSVVEKGTPSPEKQQWIEILFSDKEEAEKKNNFFGKWKKEEKPEKEKRGFFGKKLEKKNSTESGEDSDMKKTFGDFAIPGMDFQSRVQKNTGDEEKEAGRYQSRDMVIPAQSVEMCQKTVDRQDFGNTVFLEEDSEDTLWLDQEDAVSVPRFVLYRSSTKESFEIHGDVIRVGRSPTVTEICISGNRSVGRIHAILYVRDGQVFIEDNNSKNKTYIDGKALCPGEPARPLSSGSKIRMGDEELEFHVYE